MQILIEAGELQGLPGILVRGEDLNLDDQACLERAAVRGGVTNPAAIVLTGVPWGDARLDRALHILAATARWADTPVWTRRAATQAATMWPAFPVWTLLEVAPLTRAEALQDLILEIGALPWHPPPSELLLVAPPAHALTPAYLDELALRLAVEGACWLEQVDLPLTAQAVRAVSQASTRWGIRGGR